MRDLDKDMILREREVWGGRGLQREVYECAYVSERDREIEREEVT